MNSEIKDELLILKNLVLKGTSLFDVLNWGNWEDFK